MYILTYTCSRPYFLSLNVPLRQLLIIVLNAKSPFIMSTLGRDQSLMK